MLIVIFFLKNVVAMKLLEQGKIVAVGVVFVCSNGDLGIILLWVDLFTIDFLFCP